MSPYAPPLSWLFADMNSFFASLEQHFRPELRGRPVGVIPVESESTCVIAASQEAKIHGVKTGTSVREARSLCPGIRLVKARPIEYVRMHHAIARSIERCAPIHKAYSIDEWAICLGRGERAPGPATDLGCRIMSRLREEYSHCITCSVGIAPTRLLAKIASDLHKPDGLTVLQVHDLPDRLEHRSLRSLCGIGGGMSVRLEENGIHTVRDLWKLNRRQAIAVWGSIAGAHWWAGFHGYDEPEIPTRRHSMSHANVLEPRFRNETGARGILTRLVCRLGVRLRNDNYLASMLGIHMLYADGGRFSMAIELPQVQDTPALLENLYKLWDRREPAQAPPLRVGAVVSGLVPAAQVPSHLFRQADQGAHLSQAMDEINRRWGLSSLYFGSMHDYRHQMDDKIAFGRIPSLPEFATGAATRRRGTNAARGRPARPAVALRS